MTLQNLQILNSIFLFFTLPASIYLLVQLVFNSPNHTRDTVRLILILIFTSITVASIISLHLNYLLIIRDVPVSDIVFEANMRNLVKNFSFFIVSWGFLYIEMLRKK